MPLLSNKGLRLRADEQSCVRTYFIYSDANSAMQSSRVTGNTTLKTNYREKQTMITVRQNNNLPFSRRTIQRRKRTKKRTSLMSSKVEPRKASRNSFRRAANLSSVVRKTKKTYRLKCKETVRQEPPSPQLKNKETKQWANLGQMKVCLRLCMSMN